MSSTTTQNEESKYVTFQNRKLDHKDESFANFSNPFTLYSLMFFPVEMLIEWLMENNLIRSNMDCQKCHKPCNL